MAGGGEDDKFLTSDSETYSVATDKLSTAATLAGHVIDGAGGISPSAMSENDLVRIFLNIFVPYPYSNLTTCFSLSSGNSYKAFSNIN